MCVGNGRCMASDVPAARAGGVGICLAAAAAFLLFMGPSELRAEAGPPFENGYEAYQRGDFAAAQRIWRPLAEAGDLRAQYNLGLIHAEGRGVRRDPAEAVKWWRRAAQGGHVRAMHNLALAHIAGVPDEKSGVPVQDYARALEWLNRAAAEGLPNSIYFLGTMYRYGLGVERDEAKAVSLFIKSAEKGFVRAQYNLAEAYLNGTGVEPSTDEAFRWLRAAAEGGSPKAQYRMAAHFAEGQGDGTNLVEALKWCLLAARHGHPVARDTLDGLVLRASPQELQEAARRAGEVELAGRQSAH